MLEKIRKKAVSNLKIKLKQLEVDYFLIPNSDQFFLEFLPERQRRVKFISSFEGSNAFIIIGKNKSFHLTTFLCFLYLATYKIEKSDKNRD